MSLDTPALLSISELRHRETSAACRAANATQPSRKDSDASAASRAAKPRKLSFKEQRQLAGIETAILEAENRVGEIEQLLNDPGFYATRAREAPAFLAELEERKTEVARLYARWQELDALPKS